MTWGIAVGGTVSLDNVTTPGGRRSEQIGGSAVYFALAASPVATVHLVGAVGRDGVDAARGALAGSGVDLDGLEVSDQPTRRWTATHDFETWVTRRDEHADEGVYTTWSPRLTLEAAAAEMLFLGSMHPRQQLAMLEQSSARFVGSDSMVAHIGEDSAGVEQVASSSDILFLNRAELASLTRSDPDGWEDAARSLIGRGRLRAVVVKAGPLGAALVTPGRVAALNAHPVSRVVDPTGAGDSLAGGMLGACAAQGRVDDEFLLGALDAGLRRAAACISDYGVAALAASAAG